MESYLFLFHGEKSYLIAHDQTTHTVLRGPQGMVGLVTNTGEGGFALFFYLGIGDTSPVTTAFQQWISRAAV